MGKQKTRIDKMNSRIKNNPILAVLIIIGTLVIALATFTNAAKDLLGLVKPETRANINGDWIAEVPYPWNNKTYNELFTFKGEGDELLGTASLYRRKKGILEGKIKKDKLEFVIKIQENSNEKNNPKELTHHYKGTISGDQITFVLLNGNTTHLPLQFTANRIVSRSFD
jgi:hypothetical protein